MQARKTQPDQQAPQADTDAGIGLTRRALFRTTLAAATSVAMGRASAGSNALTSNENKQACNLIAVSVTINEVLHRLFITPEDEIGRTNVIVWPALRGGTGGKRLARRC